MQFEPLAYNHRAAYDACWAKSSQSSSDSCFSVLWGWQPFFGYQVAFEDGLAWIKDRQDGLLAPAGSFEETDWAVQLAKVGRTGLMDSLPEAFALELAEQLGPKVAIEEVRSSNQYLYDRVELLGMAGNRQARRRHKINQFLKHSRARFEPLSDGLIERLREYQQSWMAHQRQKGTDMTLLEGENGFILRQFEKWRDFGLLGGGLFDGDRLVGYTLAEPVPDGSLQVHVEKADEEPAGAYQAVGHLFLETLPEEYRVINREEDMGNPGLRQAKLSYGPSRFLRLYRAKWDLDAGSDAPVVWGGVALPEQSDIRPAVSSKAVQNPIVSESADSGPDDLPPLSRRRVFENLSCQAVAQCFKAKQRCAEWQAIERDIDTYLTDLAGEAFHLCDHLADHPEIGGEEHRSAAQLVKLLEQSGFAVERPFCGLDTAFLARATLGHGGPVVAFLAEYDALPGIGHGCGHNLSGVLSVYAAMALRHALARNFKEATLWVVGTPGEENLGGKIPIAASGMMDEVTLALMFHCCAGPNRVKARFLATDSYDFTFKGLPAHATCNPYDGRSAQSGVRLFLDALDMARQTLPFTNRVAAILQGVSGVANVIPEKAVVRVGLRDVTRQGVDILTARVQRMARGCAMATDTEVSWKKVKQGYDDLKPNIAAEELARRVMACLEMPLEPDCEPVASSDAGNLSKRCPVLHPYISLTPADVAIHTRDFAALTKAPEGHEALLLGARAAARIAGRVAVDADLARLIRQDFEQPGLG